MDVRMQLPMVITKLRWRRQEGRKTQSVEKWPSFCLYFIWGEKNVFPNQWILVSGEPEVGFLGSLCIRDMDFLERFEHQGKGVELKCLLQWEWVGVRRQVIWEGSNESPSRCWVIPLIQVRRKSKLLRNVWGTQGYSVLSPQPSPWLSTVARGGACRYCHYEWWAIQILSLWVIWDQAKLWFFQ